MLPRSSSIATFAIAAAGLGIAVYWGLKLFVHAPPVPAHASLASASVPLTPDWTRLFGVELAPVAVEAAAPPPDTRFQLVGLVAARGAALGKGGLAVIAVDGKPPRTYRVGGVVDGQTVLQAVQARGVSLGPRGGAVTVSLQMPPLPVAATGSLGAAAPVGGVPPAPNLVPPAQPQANAVQPSQPTFPTMQTLPTLPGGGPLPPRNQFLQKRQAAQTANSPEGGNAVQPQQTPFDGEQPQPQGRPPMSQTR